MADNFKTGDPQQPEISIDNIYGWLYVGKLACQRVRFFIQPLLTQARTRPDSKN